MPEASLILIFTTSFVVALSGSLIPGPLLTVTVSEAAQRGIWVGPLVILGHALAELALVTALALGLNELVRSEQITAIIGLAGGAILILMGLWIVSAARRQITIPTTASPGIKHGRRLILSGFLASVANPTWIIWWATLGTTYMFWSLQRGLIGITFFYTGHILADLGWYTLVALMIGGGRRFMTASLYRGLLVTCGVGLLALGGYFITSGLSYLVS